MTPELLAEKATDLLSLPEIVVRFNELLEDPNSNNADLEEVILLDPSLTSKLLKIVNSSYFGFPGKVDTVSRAIRMIGYKELKNLVMTAVIADSFRGIPEHLIDMDIFWFHSVTSGVLAKLLAIRCNRLDSEHFFLSGLLHGIGKLLMFAEYPEKSAQILSLKDQGQEAMTMQEKQVFGFTHAQVGAELLKQWQLPETIWSLIENQLQPLTAPKQVDEACILNSAIKIADRIEPCAYVEINFQDLNIDYNDPVFRHLQLTEKEVAPLIQESNMQALEIMSFIRPEATFIF